MQTGYVMDYGDNTFGQFFKRNKIDIQRSKCQSYGTSKAKKLRAFWEQEPDAVVAPVLSEMLDSYEADCNLNDRKVDPGILKKCREVVARVSGKSLRLRYDVLLGAHP